MQNVAMQSIGTFCIKTSGYRKGIERLHQSIDLRSGGSPSALRRAFVKEPPSPTTHCSTPISPQKERERAGERRVKHGIKRGSEARGAQWRKRGRSAMVHFLRIELQSERRER